MDDIRERELRERLEDGDVFTIVARQWPGGLELDPQRMLQSAELDFFHSVVKRDLDHPQWGVHAKEIEAADSVYIVGDGERANVCFGKSAARAGAFTPVYLRAFEFRNEEP